MTTEQFDQLEQIKEQFLQQKTVNEELELPMEPVDESI
jgi:hypothetical protein